MLLKLIGLIPMVTITCKILLTSFLFTQLVTEPTRITETSATVLDLVFVSIPDKVQKCSVLPGISDHELVLTDIQVRLKHVEKPKRKIYLYNKGDFDSFRIDLAEFKQDFFETDPAAREKKKKIDHYSKRPA